MDELLMDEIGYCCRTQNFIHPYLIHIDFDSYKFIVLESCF